MFSWCSQELMIQKKNNDDWAAAGAIIAPRVAVDNPTKVRNIVLRAYAKSPLLL